MTPSADAAQRPTDTRAWLVAAAVVALVALASLVFQLRLPSLSPSDDDFRAAARAIEAERAPGDVVLLYPWYTERARRFVTAAPVVGYWGSDDDALLVHPRIWLLAQPDLPRSDLSGFLSRFGQGRTADGPARTYGRLTLQRFTNGRARAVRWSANTAAARATVEGPRGTQAEAPPRAVWQEMKFQPRQCLPLAAPAPGERRVLQFSGLAAGHLVLWAGYVWDKGAYLEHVTDSELVAEVNGVRRPLLLKRGVEGYQTLDLGPVPDGASLTVSYSAANPHERVICLEALVLERAP